MWNRVCAIVDNTPCDYFKGIKVPSIWEEKNKKPHMEKKKKGLKELRSSQILFIAVKFTLALVLAASSFSL